MGFVVIEELTQLTAEHRMSWQHNSQRVTRHFGSLGVEVVDVDSRSKKKNHHHHHPKHFCSTPIIHAEHIMFAHGVLTVTLARIFDLWLISQRTTVHSKLLWLNNSRPAKISAHKLLNMFAGVYKLWFGSRLHVSTLKLHRSSDHS